MLLFKIFSILASTVTLRNCGSPTDQAPITGMGFEPQNPNPGELTELWVAYDLKTPITGGTASYSYSFNGIPFSPTIEDLCTQTSCPKEVGTYNETSTSDFPSGVTGKIITTIKWANQDSKPIWCTELTFRI